jgi:hypothetical protein
MFINLLGRASGGSSGNNANETMDMLRELEDNADGFVEVTQPEADMVMAISPQVTNAAQVPPTGDRNAGNQGPSPKYSGFNTALKKLGHIMYDPKTIERELKVQGTMDPMDAFA